MLAAILFFSILSVLMWGGTAGLFMYSIFEDKLKAKIEKKRALKKARMNAKK